MKGKRRLFYSPYQLKALRGADDLRLSQRQFCQGKVGRYVFLHIPQTRQSVIIYTAAAQMFLDFRLILKQNKIKQSRENATSRHQNNHAMSFQRFDVVLTFIQCPCADCIMVKANRFFLKFILCLFCISCFIVEETLFPTGKISLKSNTGGGSFC